MNVLNLPTVESLASCFQSLVFVSVIGSIVVLMAIAFHMATSKWISSTFLYVFWFVVLLRFVLFAVPESPTSLLNLTAQSSTEIAILESDGQAINEDELLIFSSGVVPIPIDEETVSFLWTPAKCWMVAAIAWFVVVVVLMFRFGLGYLAVRRLISETSHPAGELDARFKSLKQRLGLRLKTRLRVSDQIEVPAMAGLFNPVVILPRWCCRELDHEQLEMVLAHELIHIQRRDGLIQMVAHLIIVLHWFNPLARVAASFIESTRELSCDGRVIEFWKKTKRSATETLLIERKYGRTILDIAGRAHSVNEANNASQFSAAFLGGFVGSNQNLIKQRIAMLVSSKTQFWLRNILATGFITLLLAVGFTSAQTICPPIPTGTETVAPVLQNGGGTLHEIPMSGIPMPATQTILPNLAIGDTVVELPTPQTKQPEIFDTPVDKDVKPQPHSQLILLNAGQVKRLRFDYQIPEILVNDPAILDALPLAPKEVQFTAVAPGTTEVHVSNPNRKIQILKFRIVPDVRELKSKVEKEFLGLNVNVKGSTDGFVNLYGQVTTEQIAKINKFVVANSSLPIRNQLSDTPPIAIKIKVYEVDKTKLKNLGIDLSKSDNNLPSEVESLKSFLPENGAAQGNLMAIGKLDNFDEFLMTLEKHQISKLLDQPVLVALHGRVAEFKSGREVPFATFNEAGQPIVKFRFFGTTIQTTPHVHSKDEMTLEIAAEVSEVAEDLNSSDGVPGCRVRRINTGMRVKPKQTIALIGDYRKEGQDNESTELVFLITPRFIEVNQGPHVQSKNDSKGLSIEQVSSEFSKDPQFRLVRETAATKDARSEPNKER